MTNNVSYRIRFYYYWCGRLNISRVQTEFQLCDLAFKYIIRVEILFYITKKCTSLQCCISRNNQLKRYTLNRIKIWNINRSSRSRTRRGAALQSSFGKSQLRYVTFVCALHLPERKLTTYVSGHQIQRRKQWHVRAIVPQSYNARIMDQWMMRKYL